jgi:hypothetical protein
MSEKSQKVTKLQELQRELGVAIHTAKTNGVTVDRMCAAGYDETHENVRKSLKKQEYWENEAKKIQNRIDEQTSEK